MGGESKKWIVSTDCLTEFSHLSCFELSFTPELVKGGRGVFGFQAYLARNTSLESPPSVGIIDAGRYLKEADVLQHFEEGLVETVPSTNNP